MHPEELPGLQPLILIGLPRAGKTTLGQKLSAQTFLPFFDTDSLIETRQQESRRALFQRLGEKGFRQEEYAALQSIPWNRPCIVALGGGTLDHLQSLHLLENKGIFIYLKWDEANWRKHVEKENLLHDVDEILKKRVPVYEELAHYTIFAG